MESLEDPSVKFVSVMTSLYFSNKVTPIAGLKEVETLPPLEALVLGIMCLTKTYNSRHLYNLICRKYRIFSNEEAGILTEVGMNLLMNLGLIRPASSAAKKAMENRNKRVWGFGDVPFVITAKGARRIGFVVANSTRKPYKDVVLQLQAESKEAAKKWSPEFGQM